MKVTPEGVLKGTAITDPKVTVRIAYHRTLQVKRHVLARANGHCELCGDPAPFKRKSDGTPYLEPHHINRLSEGGLDHPLYVGAICPTCHRQIHFGIDGSALNDELRLLALERSIANRYILQIKVFSRYPA